MSTDLPARPPPLSNAPADFDAGMIERWTSWQTKGRIEGARARRQLGVALIVGGAAALAGWVTTLVSR